MQVLSFQLCQQKIPIARNDNSSRAFLIEKKEADIILLNRRRCFSIKMR